MQKKDQSPLSVVLIDDNDQVRKLFVNLLKYADRIRVVGEACDGIEAQAVLSETKPDIALVDVSMPNMNGIELVSWMAKELPTIKAIMLSSEDTEEYISQSLNSGALGYALKNTQFNGLLEGIYRAQDGTNIQQFSTSKQAVDSWQNRSEMILLAQIKRQ